MSELIHLPGQTEPAAKPTNPFEAVKNFLPEDVYGKCDIDRPWKNLDEFNENVKALSDSTLNEIFGSMVDIATQDEKSSKLAEFLQSIEIISPVERAEQSLINNSLKENQIILSLQLEAYLRKTDFFRPWLGMDIKRYWINKLEHGSSVEDLSEELKKWMDNLWDKYEAPFYSADDSQKIYDGYLKESKQSFEEVGDIQNKRRELQDKLWSLPKGKRKQRAELKKQIKALCSGSRAEELEELGFRSKSGAEKWQQIVDDAKFIETLFKGIKSKISPEDYADIWMKTAHAFEERRLSGLNIDPRLMEAVIKGVISWLDEVDSKEECELQPNDEESKRRLAKKINILKKEFKSLYNYIKNADREDDSLFASIQHAQQVLRILLKAMDDMRKIEI